MRTEYHDLSESAAGWTRLAQPHPARWTGPSPTCNLIPPNSHTRHGRPPPIVAPSARPVSTSSIEGAPSPPAPHLRHLVIAVADVPSLDPCHLAPPSARCRAPRPARRRAAASPPSGPPVAARRIPSHRFILLLRPLLRRLLRPSSRPSPTIGPPPVPAPYVRIERTPP